MDGEENLQNRAVIYHFGVKENLRCLSMPRLPRGDLLVGGVRDNAAGVAGFNALNTFDYAISCFGAPETARSQSGNFKVWLFTHKKQLFTEYC